MYTRTKILYAWTRMHSVTLKWLLISIGYNRNEIIVHIFSLWNSTFAHVIKASNSPTKDHKHEYEHLTHLHKCLIRLSIKSPTKCDAFIFFFFENETSLRNILLLFAYVFDWFFPYCQCTAFSMRIRTFVFFSFIFLFIFFEKFNLNEITVPLI